MGKAVQFPGIDANGKRDRATIPYEAIKQVIVAGAAADTNIAIAGIKLTDTILAAVNLTDLTNVIRAAIKSVCDPAGNFDTVLEAHTAGAAGNGLTVTLVGDSPGAGGVTIGRVGNAFTIHYESGVSTITNVETAIAALAGADDLMDVKTGGTGATVLTAPGDNVAVTPFTGGSDAITNELPVITEAGQIQFPNCDTTNKKILVLYADLG